MKRLYYLYSLLLLFACSARLAAQNQDSIKRLIIDSLKHELKYVGNKQKELEMSSSLGYLYNMSGKYDSARVYLNRALSLPGGQERDGGRLLTNLANSYGFEGKYAEALKYYMEALAVSEQLAASKKSSGMGKNNVLRTMANIAEVHYLTGNRKQALHYAERGMELYEEIFKPDNQAIDYMIPQILYVIGSVHLDRNDLDKAEEAMQKTGELADTVAERTIRKHNSPYGMWMYVAYGKEGQARVCLARKNYAQALEYAAEALSFAEKNGDPTVTAKIFSTFSDIYLAQENYEESGRFTQKAMEIFPNYPDVNPGAAFNAAVAGLFAGDKAEAYRYFRLYADRMKANTDKQFRETMAGMEVVYETEKKELRIAKLEQEKMLVIGVGIVAVLMAIMLWIIFRQKIRNEKKEKQIIVANALIEGEKRGRERLARNLHDSVNSKLSTIRSELAARGGMQDMCDGIESCIEEIRHLASGVMPVSLQRYGLKAAVEDCCRLFSNVYFQFFGKDLRVAEDIELAVYYCAYELVHNSVQHSGAEDINVHLIQEEDRISLTVQDNGCGYDKDSFVQGVGLKSLRDRIAALNGEIDINSSPEYGTETMIELRIKRKK